MKISEGVLKDVEKIRSIEIDVEGVGFNVFKGAFNVISKWKQFIVFEQNKVEFSDDLKESRAISHLCRLGFGMVIVEVARNKKSWFYRRFFNVFEFILEEGWIGIFLFR